MKLLERWKDKNYSATNSLYQLSNKAKLFHTVKADIKDFDIHIIFKGGSSFENEIGVPNGTVHFLEHMLMNPNKVLKTDEEQRQFEFGTRKTPTIFKNASTWKKLIGFEAGCHFKGANKALEYLSYIIDYPLERFEEFFEIEREVILAEERGEYKIEKDTGYNYFKFMLESIYPEFTTRIIGFEDTIKSITVTDLKKAHSQIFTADNCVIAIQSPEKLTKVQLDLIEQIVKPLYKKKNTLKIKPKKLKNTFKYKHFKDDNAQGISLYFNRFKEMSMTPEYSFNVSYYILRNLLSYLGHNYLRDKKGLIYGLNTFWTNAAWNTNIQGFNLTFDKKNLEALLEELEFLFETKINEFLTSDQGTKWFEAQVSKYIFLTTTNYDYSYAQNVAMDIVIKERAYKYNFAESLKIAKSYLMKDFMKFVDSFLIESKPHIWIESPFEDNEIVPVFEKSSWFKRFNR